jgi:hypothetical protein
MRRFCGLKTLKYVRLKYVVATAKNVFMLVQLLQ